MIKFSKKEKSFKKPNPELNLNFYWKLVICFIFIFFVLSLVFGYYLFMQINKETVFDTSSNNNQVETVKKETIQKVLDYFSQREQKSQKIISSPAPVVDPSL